MRTVFFILILANVVLFAYFWTGGGEDARGEAQIIAQQLNPEKIRLIAPEQAKVLAIKPAPPTVASACLEWGAFSGGEVTRAAQALDPLGLGAKLAQRSLEEVTSFWVYIPPQGTRQVAMQKASELKRLGVDDYFVVSDDPTLRFAISLGVFKTEEAAKARLSALRVQGVRSARVGARETQLSKVYYQVREADATLAAKLNALKQGFPGSEVRACVSDEKKS